MKWKGRKESEKVDDRSRDRSSRKVPRRPTRSGRTKSNRKFSAKRKTKASALGVGCLLLIFLPVTCIFGGFGIVGSKGTKTSQSTQASREKGKQKSKDELKAFIKVVVNDADEFWKRKKGKKYASPTVVFYDRSTKSACGTIRKSLGPLYCVLDKKIYVPPSWMETMERRRGIYGDFAMAFVIAHEFGHHIQNVEGRSWKIIKKKRKASKKDAKQLARRMELQADCYAGMFAAHAKKKKWLEVGDVDEAINAAEKMGDDHIRQKYGGDLDPDSFGHGSSKQRKTWFNKGLKSPSQKTCDTFKTKSL